MGQAIVASDLLPKPETALEDLRALRVDEAEDVLDAFGNERACNATGVSMGQQTVGASSPNMAVSAEVSPSVRRNGHSPRNAARSQAATSSTMGAQRPTRIRPGRRA
jgi:hypothetical protein